MQNVDTLIYAGWIIPVVPENTVYEHHAIAINDGKIVAILPSDQAASLFSARITHRLTTHLLIPGLINSHTHAAMTLLRGFASDLPLSDWLTRRIWPAEAACVSREFVMEGTKLAMAEMLRGGITCFNDMYFFPDVVAEVAEQAGMRASIGLIVIDFPTVWAQNPDEYLQKGREVYQRFESQPLLKFTVSPHAPYTVSDAPLQAAHQMAETLDLQFHIHLHETAEEVQQSLSQYQLRPMARLDKLGVLTARTLAVHATQLTAAEITQLAEKSVHVIHCPESNLKLASGFCPITQLHQAGVNVALGTDGAASNDDLDILGEMRTAALLAKGVSQDAKSIPASVALQMATLNGARALGIAQITGSLEVGKAADIVAIDMQQIETQPIYDLLSHLVYAVSRERVTDVWVAGKQLLKSRALTSLDIRDIATKTVFWREKILNSISN